MTATVDADLAVVGGGCAGLSLAVALTSTNWPGRRPRIAIIEPRTAYVRDRTWCLWPVEPQPFTAAIRHRWARWEVRTPTRQLLRGSATTPYVHIAADAFYELALAHLRAAGVGLHLGVLAEAIDDTGDAVTIATSAGSLRAGLVFDSRPPAPDLTNPAAITLLQHFVGWEITTASPRFDPSTAILMDFAVPQGDGLHFFYVLPFTADRALVEATYFSRSTLPHTTYTSRIRDYLGERFDLHEFAIDFRERGVIPMTTAPAVPQPSPRVYHLGLRGGFAKPSTGYAFLASQRYAAAMARRLAAAPPGSPPPPPPPRSAIATAMDRVFLSFLDSSPDRAPELFGDLFERVPADLLIRFLSDRAGPRECLRVMAATPLARMTREVLRSRAQWLRPASR